MTVRNALCNDEDNYPACYLSVNFVVENAGGNEAEGV